MLVGGARVRMMASFSVSRDDSPSVGAGSHEFAVVQHYPRPDCYVRAIVVQKFCAGEQAIALLNVCVLDEGELTHQLCVSTSDQHMTSSCQHDREDEKWVDLPTAAHVSTIGVEQDDVSSLVLPYAQPDQLDGRTTFQKGLAHDPPRHCVLRGCPKVSGKAMKSQ